MDRYTFRDEILRALGTDSRRKLAARGEPRRFNCPKDDHSSPGSAWIGDHAWGCFACDFEEPLGTLADLLGVEKPAFGFTLEQYADRKAFNIGKLEEWGLRTINSKLGGSVVEIPYRALDGTLLRNKLRGTKGSYWDDRRGTGVHLYGLDRLAAAPPTDPVILVEGESDCHAAWHSEITAVGIPGASTWKPEWAQYFAGRQVYVWQEPGAGGELMVRSIAPHLPDARVIRADDVKDLAELRQRVGGGQLARAIAARIAQAHPIGTTPPIVTFHALVGPRLDYLMRKKLEPIEAVPTCLPTWNSHCRDEGGGEGLARGWHITIGANTGSGKSLIALNLAFAAMARGESVCFLSLEMSEMQLATRLLSIVSGVSVNELENGRNFRQDRWREAARQMDEILQETGGRTYTNERRLNKLDDVVDCMRYQHEVFGCKYMIIDYLQLAFVDAKNEYEAIQKVSHRVRDTAVELNIISVGLSQFNRETSKNRLVPPTPQGLLGGSALENDSDQVVLLDHSFYERDSYANTALTRVLLAKNRHGGQASIDVKWDYRTLRLKELSPAGEYIADVGDAPAARFNGRADAGEAITV